jgi:hypothetical protein
MMTHVVSPTAARSWARSLDRDETVGPREALVRLVDGFDLEGPLERPADASPVMLARLPSLVRAVGTVDHRCGAARSA